MIVISSTLLHAHFRIHPPRYTVNTIKFIVHILLFKVQFSKFQSKFSQFIVNNWSKYLVGSNSYKKCVWSVKKIKNNNNFSTEKYHFLYIIKERHMLHGHVKFMDILLSIFRENLKAWHFLWNVCLADYSHNLSSYFQWKLILKKTRKEKKYVNILWYNDCWW